MPLLSFAINPLISTELKRSGREDNSPDAFFPELFAASTNRANSLLCVFCKTGQTDIVLSHDERRSVFTW